MVRSTVLLPLIAAFSVACTLPAFADELEEIVVTADLRERSAAELPPAISVLDEAEIEAAAVQHFEELIQLIPNLNWSGDGHRARYLQIRGIGERSQYEGAPNPSVGFLVDDIDFSGIGTLGTLFDVQQIEVLRGPQGTRYGANALAGLVYIQGAEPGDKFGARLQLEAGGDDLRAGGVALGGPLGENAGIRIAAHQHRSNGFRDNPYLGREDTNGRDEATVRGKLTWQAGKDWSFRLAALYADIDDGYDAFAIDNSLTMLSDKPGRDAQRSFGSSLRAEWSGSPVASLTSITSFAESDIRFSFDADWGNPDSWAPYVYDFIVDNDRLRRTLSQEVRLVSGEDGRIFDGRADWLVGAYVLQMEDALTTRTQGDYYDPFFDFALSVDDRLASDFEALTTALFGELDIEVSDAGSFVVGLRTERRDTDYVDTNGLDLGPAETMFGGELRYRHALDEGTSVFVGLSRGYKAGGFNLGMVPEDRRRFDAESLTSLEAGVRASRLDDRLQLNATLFANRYRDQQVQTSFQLNPNDPASFVFFTDNAASGRALGLELETRLQATDRLELFANVGLLRAEFDDFVTPQLDQSGRDQAHAPRYTLAAGGSWRDERGFFARVDVSAKDDFYFSATHDQRSEAYMLVHARAGYDSERWSIALWGRNLGDETYAVRGFFFGNEPGDFPDRLYFRQGDARQLGVTLQARF